MRRCKSMVQTWTCRKTTTLEARKFACIVHHISVLPASPRTLSDEKEDAKKDTYVSLGPDCGLGNGYGMNIIGILEDMRFTVLLLFESAALAITKRLSGLSVQNQVIINGNRNLLCQKWYCVDFSIGPPYRILRCPHLQLRTTN